MQEDNHEVSDEIMRTYYANSFFSTDEELRKLGIDPSRVYRIHNGPQTPLPAFLAQVDQVVDEILSNEKK